MRRLFLFSMFFLMVFAIGCSQKEPPKEQIIAEEKMQSVLPEGWWIASIEENTAPFLWDGPAECKLVQVENPSETYQTANGNYTAFWNFWFCPQKWQGSMQHNSPVLEVCNCSYRIFAMSFGENSQKDLPEKAKMAFVIAK
jgi:hypothetical protein